ncbi:MAG TPA: RluA family pseudouridine synthase [Pyrinomonadaceae bacterium]|jgi:23S rRNA pseudouridine1911/1915/1917 synthase
MEETIELRVDESEAGARLDAYLAARIEGWSRARIQRLIEDGDVLVKGRAAKSAYKLRAGDVVEVELTEPTLTAFAPEPIPLDIIYEDEELVVVNKPAGLVVHPGAGVPSGTLANALTYHFEQLSKRAGAMRPGIVHRLDKDTSGLIVVAKTEDAHEKLAEQFRTREVFKSYVVLVHGRLKEDAGRIEQPLARDPRHRTRMAVVRGGRPALSLYKVRRGFDRFTLLDVEIKTGRTHQIRVHLQWLKHPVVGDETYGGGRDKTVPDVRVRAALNRLGRIFLHAEQLGFHHPKTGAELSFTAPLPAELTGLLEII